MALWRAGELHGEGDGASAADSALGLHGNASREERAGDPRRVIGKDEIEGAVREWEAMGVCATDERREVHEVEPRPGHAPLQPLEPCSGCVW